MNSKKIMLSLLYLSFTHAIYSMEKNLKTDYEHISNYIGSHAYTREYLFQEALRKNDLGIKKIIEQKSSKEAEKFFINGWGQIIGALIALKQYQISSDFNNVVDQNIDAAIKKGNKKDNPFVTVNVREQAKNIMTYPHQGKYLPWQKTNITEPIFVLNNLLKKHPTKFSLVDGKCHLNIGKNDEQTIFTELWASDFATFLAEQNYFNLQANQEHPHITLINSNIIAAIKDKFSEKYGSEGTTKFKSFMDSWLEVANDELAKEDNSIKFTQFDSSYSEDYSPFEEVVVAKLNAPKVKDALKVFADKAKEEVDYNLTIKDENSFHLTVATKYRKPNDFSHTTIEEILRSCPKESSNLLRFFEEFKK